MTKYQEGHKASFFQHCMNASARISNSKMSGLIWPKIELDQALMPVLLTSNFDDDSIKNERASMETAFSHYKSMGHFETLKGS